MKDKFIWCLLILIIIGVIGVWFWMDYINKKDVTNISDISENSITTNEVSATTSDDKDWSSYKTYNIELSSETVTITEEGVYNITGTLTDNNIVIKTEGNVKLILNNVTIKNSNGPAINVENAKNVYIELVGENTIDATVTEELDAAIYSSDDLFFEGDGTLNITSNIDGIKSSDDLTIYSGTFNIEVSDDAIVGKDSVIITDGIFKLVTGSDGIKSTNTEDTSKGYILIEGGIFDIKSGSDGIQSVTKLTINDGTYTINSSEGLESTYIVINKSTITINASDDGINASSKSSSTPKVEINGGDITIKMGQGDTDGIDSNGDIVINGGTINVTGQSTFDYDGEGTINGGTVICNGEKVTTLPNQMMGGGQMGPGQGGQPNGQNRIK